MPITTELFNYNVAKVIDTPWNTIINGMNYTKTNLAPLGLKYTFSSNYDCGMMLKEFAGNSRWTGNPIEDFCWNCGEYDNNDSNKYWLLNLNHKSQNYAAPYYMLRKAQRMVDENGFEYSEITNHTTIYTGQAGGKIIYQTDNLIYLYYNESTNGGSNNCYLYKVEKKDITPNVSSLVAFRNGIIHILDISKGYIWYYAQYGDSSMTAAIGKIDIATGTNISLGSWSIGTTGAIASYPTNIVDESFYVYYFTTNNMYKFTFNNDRASVTSKVVSFDENETVFTSGGNSYVGDMKRFQHLYKVGDEKYLVALTLNSYHRAIMTKTSAFQVYKIEDDDTLTRTQCIIIDGLSLIPKNDWNTWFVGQISCIRVFNWDMLDKKMVEKPSIPTTCQQFGFDLDGRLWIMDVDYNISRYTYNQPTTIDYKFEYEKYHIGTEIVETYVDVRVMNYMGDNLNVNVKLKAIGNFTFINNQKELAISLSSNGYVRVPVYLNGSGKYEIRLK